MTYQDSPVPPSLPGRTWRAGAGRPGVDRRVGGRVPGGGWRPAFGRDRAVRPQALYAGIATRDDRRLRHERAAGRRRGGAAGAHRRRVPRRDRRPGASHRTWALLASCPADRPRALHLLTEGLTARAERLYARYGFMQQFAEDVMLRDLHAPIPDAPLPLEIALATWTPALAPQFFEAYDSSFRDRPGFPGWSAEQWIAWVADDDEFRPELSLLATATQQPVGFVVCSDE
jgi:hypothetical protein